MVVLQGASASLCCASTGEPVPIQTWSRNGTALSGSRYLISDDGMVLTISDVMQDDVGVYTCHASNIAGEDSATVVLDVNCKRITS